MIFSFNVVKKGPHKILMMNIAKFYHILISFTDKVTQGSNILCKV